MQKPTSHKPVPCPCKSKPRRNSCKQCVLCKSRSLPDITAEVQAYAALQRQLQTLIDSLPVPEDRTLLELRYLSGSKWEEIAEAMSMHVRWVYRMHGRALQAAQKILDAAK